MEERLMELIKEQVNVMDEIIKNNEYLANCQQISEKFNDTLKTNIELIDYEVIVTLEIMKYGLMNNNKFEEFLNMLKRMKDDLTDVKNNIENRTSNIY